MNSETYKFKESKNMPKKPILLNTNKKDSQIERALRQEVDKRKRDSEINISMKTQDKNFASARSKKENSNLIPSVLSEEKMNLLEDKKKLKQMEAQSILEKIKREVLTKHLDNLGADSRKRSPALRDLAIQRAQPIQNILEQEVSARIIPISAGDAYLRNMSKSPDLHKSYTSNILSNNISQMSNTLPIRHIPKEDREQHSYIENNYIPSNLTPYQHNTRTYHHFRNQNQNSLKFDSTQGEIHKTKSEKLINAYSTDTNKFYEAEGRTATKNGPSVKFELDSQMKSRDEELVKANTYKNIQKSIIDIMDDSNEFDLISEVNPQRYSKDTVVVSTGGKNTVNNTIILGDLNDSKFVRKKVFYEIYGKNFSNRLSDFLLRKQKSSQHLIQTKIEQEIKDINEKMKINQKRTKFNEDVSANIVHHRNIFNGQRSPESVRSKINQDDTLLSHKAPSIFGKNSKNSNNTSIMSKDYSDMSFKEINRGGVVLLNCRGSSSSEKDFIMHKKFNRNDVFRIPQKQMENAAKFIQVVWKEHSKIRRYFATKIQSKWRGFKLRSKVGSVLYDYYLLQNKIVNLEKLIAQQFSRRLLNHLMQISKIDRINRKNILVCIILLQRMFRRYYLRKKKLKKKNLLFKQQRNVVDWNSNYMEEDICNTELMKSAPGSVFKEKKIIKPIFNIPMFYKVNVKNVIKKISYIQKNLRRSNAFKKSILQASYRKKISPKIITKKHKESLDGILKIIKIQRKWKQIVNKKQAFEKLKSNMYTFQNYDLEYIIEKKPQAFFSSKIMQILSLDKMNNANRCFTKNYKNMSIKKLSQLQNRVKKHLNNIFQSVQDKLQNKLIAKDFANSIFDKIEKINQNSDKNLCVELNQISQNIISQLSKKNSEKRLICRYSIDHSESNIFFSIPYKIRKTNSFKLVTKENKNNLYKKVFTIQRFWKGILKKNDIKRSCYISPVSKKLFNTFALFNKVSKFQAEKNIITIQKYFRQTIAIKNKQNLIIKNYKQSQIKSNLICEEISLDITTETKDQVLRFTSIMNKVILKENLRKMRIYQLNDMAKQLFSRLINKARLKLILLPLRDTSIRIRILALIYEISKNFKRAAGRFIFSKLRQNLTAYKQAMRSKQMIELMHKQMTCNYNIAMQEYMNPKLKLNLEKENKANESTSLNYEDDSKSNREMHKSNKDFSATYKRNVYSYGWYINTQPKPIPYISGIEQKFESKTPFVSIESTEF